MDVPAVPDGYSRDGCSGGHLTGEIHSSVLLKIIDELVFYSQGGENGGLSPNIYI